MPLFAILALSGFFSPQEPNGISEFVLKSLSPSFQITLPAGYRRAAKKETPLAFERQAGRATWEVFRLEIVPLHQALAQDAPIHLEDIAPPTKLIDVREAIVFKKKLRWAELDIDCIECHHTANEVDAIALIAKVPLAPEAIAVSVSGPSTLERELRIELTRLTDTLKGSTNWLTENDRQMLAYSRWPVLVVPALSTLFLAAWVVFFRGHPMQAHGLRVAWHLAVVVAMIGAYMAFQQSQAARAKLQIETPHLLWFVVVAPLSLFHALMGVRRIKMGTD